MKATPIKITWRDSKRYTYQMENDEETKVTIIETIGWLYKTEKDNFVVCQDILDECDVRGVIVIPKENVVSKKYLIPEPK